MNAAELHAAIAQLDQQGLSAAAVAAQLGRSQRTVHRARRRRAAA
ncbi:helix-turn-helix domain-containing protein [Streptomyces sp. NPDC058291]